MNIATFKTNLKIAALDRQAALFARADALDLAASKEGFETRKRARLHAEATVLRDEAGLIGDRYFTLAAA